MDTHATPLLSGLNDLFSIEICSRISQIYRERGAECVLRSGIWFRVDGRDLDAILRRSSADSSALRLGEHVWMKQDKEEEELQSNLTTIGDKDRG